MAVNWDIEGCKDWEQLTETDSERRALDTVIMMTMAFDIGQLTDDNLQDWLDRARIVEAIRGPAYHKPGERCLLGQREFMQKYVGLRTNVTTKKSTVAWFKDFYKGLEMDRKYREEIAEAS